MLREVLAEHAGQEGVRVEDVRVVLERDVAQQHVVQEHAEAPDERALAVVVARRDPLGRTVHAGACANSGNTLFISFHFTHFTSATGF